MIVYSVTNRDSFDRLGQSFKSVGRIRRKNEPVVILVGNKNDGDDRREVTEEEGRGKAQEMGVAFIETSAKTGRNVARAFDEIFQQVAEGEEGQVSGQAAPMVRKRGSSGCIIA